ncbi:thiamine pyrophosphate-binding protein, partial [Paucilactobacillus nenjiangensis]|uniref:thiamine pyrophosphate-binding protein n=1 Tax=Paucilactobacillus nenjiangensis TaxID=1296540 RepID=UPI003F9A17CF
MQETRNETQMVNGSKLMVEALTDEKVEMLFGYPGGTILPEYDEMYQAEFKNILVRHEQGATHAAEGYAKSTGKTGVVLVTSGPGATNAVTGVADAMRDSVPLVVFTGQVGTGLIGTDAFQEADVLSIYKSISKKAIQIRSATDVANVVHQAFEIAQSGRKGPVVVDLPKNVMSEEVTRAEVKQWESESNFSTELKSDSKEKLKAMMKDLRAAKQPVLLVGGGAIAANASQEFRQFAEKHQIPVISSLLGLGVVHSENPQFMGMAGMHGSFAANKALHNSDFLINIGCRFEDRLATNPKKFAPKAKISHIDIDPNEIGKIIRTDYGVVADAKAALTAMLEEPSTADNH